MGILTRFYRILNLLSFDVSLGAIICSLYFSKILLVVPTSQNMLALGFTVWIIYTVDRLFDVRGMTNAATSERHQFHQRYQKALWIASTLVVLITLIVVYFLNRDVLLGGIVLSLLAAVYLIFQRHLKVKEFFVAFIYTGGVVLTSLLATKVEISLVEILWMFQFFVIALINLLLFSWFEYDTDKKDGQPSFATWLGKTAIGKWIIGLGVINIVVTVLMFFETEWWQPSMLFSMMTFSLLSLYCFSDLFQVKDRYRLIGDAVFFIPAIGLLS